MQDDLYARAPSFSKFLTPIFAKSPLQKKAITQFLSSCDDLYFMRAEKFASNMLVFLTLQKIEVDYVVDSYLKMCKDMLIEQIKFQKQGSYSCKDAATALRNVYSSEFEMASYMYGLALSQFLWPNHYGLFSFFIEQSNKLSGRVRKYCEVGPGHGLYLSEAITLFPEADYTGIDISPISANITKKIVKHFTSYDGCRFIVEDINRINVVQADYVVMCEVLEHLDEPQRVLNKIFEMLKEDGQLFITTCANCPAIDHVYLYRSVNQIRQQLIEARFQIVSEIALPVGNYDESEWERKSVGINYAAMLRKCADNGS